MKHRTFLVFLFPLLLEAHGRSTTSHGAHATHLTDLSCEELCQDEKRQQLEQLGVGKALQSEGSYGFCETFCEVLAKLIMSEL